MLCLSFGSEDSLPWKFHLTIWRLWLAFSWTGMFIICSITFVASFLYNFLIKCKFICDRGLTRMSLVFCNFASGSHLFWWPYFCPLLRLLRRKTKKMEFLKFWISCLMMVTFIYQNATAKPQNLCSKMILMLWGTRNMIKWFPGVLLLFSFKKWFYVLDHMMWYGRCLWDSPCYVNNRRVWMVCLFGSL